MKTFKILKRFSLSFLGEAWKEAYLDFNALTIGDVKEKFKDIALLSVQDQTNITQGIDSILAILTDKFVGGKAVGEKDALVEVDKTDLEALPIEVLSKALSFLSQGATETSPKP